MFTLNEKKYLLKLLLKESKRSWFKKQPNEHQALQDKLEQMIRNEELNKDHF